MRREKDLIKHLQERRNKMKKYEDIEICKKCGGNCCKRMPGIYYPKDFGNTEKEIFDNLKKAFRKGYTAVDWWDNYEDENGNEFDAYFIRPKTKDKWEVIKDPSWGGECIYLAENGCRLKYEDRPTVCRLLEPKSDGKCITHSLYKKKIAEKWLPYNELIDKAIREVINEN